MAIKFKICASAICVMLFLVTKSQAQKQHDIATGLNNNSTFDLRSRSEFQLDFFSRRRATKKAFSPIGFSLKPYASAKVGADLITPMAGLNLQVLGSGTVGRLTKWTGITSTNSFIGDSSIFEDKLGNVGIGTDTPTSRLTVAGTIQLLSGGFKFPDGTVQTTSATGALFGVAHDATLMGNGTNGSPLGVSVPLILSGSVNGGVIQANNTGDSIGIRGQGGFNNSSHSAGVFGAGGDGDGFGGDGVHGEGGFGDDFGGNGVHGEGGFGDSTRGGSGVRGEGGFSNQFGGEGVFAVGGSGNFGPGIGVVAIGGAANDASNRGGDGLYAIASEGLNGAPNGMAGRFTGDVDVSGNLSKGGGSFKIDHPLDPENKYLYHSFVESPDMMNIYNGNITTDEKGEAIVALPDYFAALNRDFRYQLTVIGAFAQAIVADEIKRNRFTIKTSAPNVKVSWQVTGIRQDAYANKNRIKVEEAKSEKERGYYLHPEVFNQPEENGVEWARNPEMMQRMKETRDHLIQKAKQLNKQNAKEW